MVVFEEGDGVVVVVPIDGGVVQVKYCEFFSGRVVQVEDGEFYDGGVGVVYYEVLSMCPDDMVVRGVHGSVFGASGESLLIVSTGTGNDDTFQCHILHGGVVEVSLYHPVMPQGVSECKLKLQLAEEWATTAFMTTLPRWRCCLGVSSPCWLSTYVVHGWQM
jgi:hypothetical protein